MKTKLYMNNFQILSFLLTFMISIQSYSYEDKIIAIVNDSVILESELNDKLARLNMTEMSRIQISKIKNDVLDKLIEESLLQQAADRLGINISDIDLQNHVKQIANSQKLTVLQLKDAVEQQNIDYIQYLNNLKRRIQIQELFRTQFINRAYISDEELDSYLNNSNDLTDIDHQLSLTEYIIEDEYEKIDYSKIKIVMHNLKIYGYDDTVKKYPNFKISVNNMRNISFKGLPDIYQTNLKILDSNRNSSLFRTGKGYVLLKVDNSEMLNTEYKVSHILMKTNPMESKTDVKNKFYEIKNQIIKNNENFSDYAKKYSLDKVSAIKGGSLGWIEKNMVVPQFATVMSNINIGEISQPFKTQYGWHIVFLEDKRIKNTMDKIKRNKAITILKERKVEVAKQEWLTKLKDQAYIEIIQ